MKFYLLFILFGFWACKITPVKSQSKCSFQISSEIDVELHGFVFKSFQSSTLRICFDKCTQDHICQSINYNTQLFLCEFSTEIKRDKISSIRAKKFGVYVENPKRAKRGSHALLPGHSCKQIKDLGHSRGDGEYWIDPESTGNPMTVFCDMTTDSGGWTLIRQAKLNDTNPNQHGKKDSYDYRSISEYKDIRVNTLVPALQKLRTVIGFTQLRFYCHKKSNNRTLHIKTLSNSTQVLDHYLVKPSFPTACGTFKRFPDDNSELGRNCLKWGNYGGKIEVNRWGRSSNTGNWRIYNNVILWENKNYLQFYAGSNYFCDDFKKSGLDLYGALNIGDTWELYVR